MANSFRHQMVVHCCPRKGPKKPPRGVPASENRVWLRNFSTDELDVRFDRFQLIDSGFV
jgi:hypothetical protein